jgi:uncharacterized membrane protein YfcA
MSGLFGVGGGIIMVPLLVWLTGVDQKRASALSLAAIIPAAAVGAVSYGANGEIDVPAALALAAGAVPGALLGTALLRRINVTVLRLLFVLLLVLVAVRMLLVVPPREAEVPLDVPLLLLLFAVGVLTGIASGLLGVGGGVVIVPVLIAGFGVGDLLAKGTSLAVIVPTSLVGTASNARRGLVELRPALAVGVAAALASYPGVATAFLLPPRVAAIAFAVLLLATAIQLGSRTWRDLRRPR